MRFSVRLLLLAFFLCITTTFALAQEPATEGMLRHVAATRDLARENLEVVHETLWVLPLTEQTLHMAKVMDRATGNIYGVAADASGDIVDEQVLQAAERQAYLARYGKLSPDLFDRMQQTTPDETIPVLIWLDEQGQVPSALRFASEQRDAISAAEVKAAQIRYRDQVSAALARVQAPVRAHIATLNGQGTYPSHFAPIILTELSPPAIQALEARSDVVYVGLMPPMQVEKHMDSVAQTVRVDQVWTEGYTGSANELVAVLEGWSIDTRSPYLNIVARHTSLVQFDNHKTEVAGIIAGQHPDYPGIAPDVGLLDANINTVPITSALFTAADWAVAQGANVINVSMGDDSGGQLTEVDRYFDYLVRHNNVTVVASAGNEGETAHGRVTSYGLGYNVLTVGSFGDSDTSNWSDDHISAFSSYANPVSTYGDREKPEVVAVGEPITTTHIEDGCPVAGDYVCPVESPGTSHAAPVVAGQAALLMQRDDYLKVSPESVRAVIMASAIHNIEGESRLSDYDGAGGVDLYMADTVVKNGWWANRLLTPDSFDGDNNYDMSAPVQAGERVRVVIAWHSNPSSDYSSDPLDADLDLQVLDPDGLVLTGPGAHSESFDNSFEIVEFDAAKTGNYTWRIKKYRFDGASEYIGVAWARIAPLTISSLDIITDNPAYFYNPGLSGDGGIVYFNSASGMGAGQTLTVAAAWSSGLAPSDSFDGGAAFGDDPSPDTDAPWTQTYSVEQGAGTQASVPFIVTDQIGRAAVAYVTFQADNMTGVPPLFSPTHPDENEWYTDNDVTFDWDGLSDASGIAGYSFVFDHSDSTVPGTSVNTTSTSQNYSDLSDGMWYFHVRAVDHVGNWGGVAHYRVQIDSAAPGIPSVASATHPDQNMWYNNDDVTLSWGVPSDAASGVDGYSYVLDGSSSTLPDTSVGTRYNSLDYTNLADGQWYFHVRAGDYAANWGGADHYRIRIDTTAPPAPSISSSTHPTQGTCYPDQYPSFAWPTPDDVSGITGFSYELDHNSNTIPDTSSDGSGNSTSYAGLAGGDWYFHVRAKDGSGKWGETGHYHICIDTPAVGPLVIDSHMIDDDANGESAGDGDGIVECGETIELYARLRNQGSDAADGVNATISESDPYIDFISNTSSSYPNIPGGEVSSNSDDFEFTLDPNTPDGHVIHFDLDVTASNGGPWADSFDISVACSRPDLVVSDITPDPPSPLDGQPVDFTVDILNQGDSSTASWGSFTVGCYMDSSPTPFDTETVSSLGAGTATSVHCYWTASEGPHTITAVVDDGGDIPELEEDNNQRSESLAVGGACNDSHEPNGSWGQATPISYGTTLSDPDICPTGDGDYYAFTGQAGDNVIIDVDAQSIGSSLDSYLYLFDTDGISVIAQNDNYDGLDSRITFVLPWDGTFYLRVQDADHPNEGGPDYFYTLSLTLDQDDVGPLVYEAYTVDDDNDGQSVGNNDGVINCGETIELFVALQNQGSDLAEDVDAVISESDPYVNFIYNTTSGYLNIPGGESRDNGNDFDFTVDPTTLHGHVIHFDLDITASNGGPWSDAFDVTVACSNQPPHTPANPSPAHDTVIPDVDVTLSWTGGDPDGDNVTYDVYLEAWDVTPDELVCNDVPIPSCVPGTLEWEIRYEWYVVATDQHGESSTGPGWHFFTPPPPVGPLVYAGHRVLDDGYWGPADGDGQLDCGEAIRLPLTLRNQGGYTATTVSADVSVPSDPYVTMIEIGAHSYPEIPGGGTAENDIWDSISFAVGEDTPDGHIIHFDLTTEAASSGPWSDSFDVQVMCTRPDLVVTSITPEPLDPVEGQQVYFRVDITNQGEVPIASVFEVNCYADGSPTPFDTETYSDGLPEGASDWVTCNWTAVEGSHTITAVVDEGDGVAESHENNNELSYVILVGETCGDPYEYNDEWPMPTPIHYGEMLPGAFICGPGDVDFYAVSGVLAGTVIQVDIDAQSIGSSLDSDLYIYDPDLVEVAHNDNYDGTDSYITYTVARDGVYFFLVREANHPDEGDVGHFYNISFDGAQQLQYMSHTVDDDADGLSIGNGDGVVNCGETVELFVSLRNEEFDRDATGVSGTLSESDSYVSVIEATRGYPDMPVFELGINTKPFVFQVADNAPDGHVIHFDLDLFTSVDLPRYAHFDVPVACLNLPPNVPSNPSPVDGASDQDLDVDVSWTGGDPDPGDSVTFDVFFGDSSPPPLVSSGQTTESYDPGSLVPETQYYWQVVTQDNHGATTEGPEWKFTTAEAVCIARLNGTDYDTIQAAVDASTTPGDVIKVTGLCREHDILVDKTLTLQGGWSESFSQHDPGLYPTIIDAGHQGRVLYLDGYSIAPIVEYLILTNGSAGGVRIGTQTDATLRGNVIENNEAPNIGDGGGVNVNYFGSATLIGNTIRYNRAGRHGGGVTAARNVTLINNVIADNVCAEAYSYGQGAGIWLGSGELYNNTLANNVGGDGSAIRANGDVVLKNTILFGNTVGVHAYGGVTTLEGTLWYGNGQNTIGDGSLDIGSINIYQDPAFADPATGDYHLTAGSPAINAGVAVSSAVDDRDGNPRPNCFKWDIGAFEYQDLSCTSYSIYLPAILRTH